MLARARSDEEHLHGGESTAGSRRPSAPATIAPRYIRTVKAVASIALLLATALIAVSAADAKPRNPRLEKLALNPADMALAKKAVVQRSDLVAGWKGGAMTPDGSAPPDCKWMDYSAYTMTGRSDVRFTQGYSLISASVQVFPNRAQALGDFKRA